MTEPEILEGAIGAVVYQNYENGYSVLRLLTELYQIWILLFDHLDLDARPSSGDVRELERLRYPRQYVRQAEDSFTHRLRQSYGFKTSSVTRPLVIAGLVEVVREHAEWLRDKDTLNEMLTFVRNENGRPEAQVGAHDDCVMSLAIAYYVRDRVPAAPQESTPFVSIERRETPWSPGPL